MELSITAIIGIIGVSLTALVLFGGIIAGFVRLESKTNTNSSDITDLYQKVESHSQDKSVHHDGEELNRRFGGLENGIREIKTELKNGLENISNRIDKLFQK